MNGIGLQGLVDLRQVFTLVNCRFLIGWIQIENLSEWFGTNFWYWFYNERIHLESDAQPNLIFINYITVLGLVTWQKLKIKIFYNFRKNPRKISHHVTDPESPFLPTWPKNKCFRNDVKSVFSVGYYYHKFCGFATILILTFLLIFSIFGTFLKIFSQ